MAVTETLAHGLPVLAAALGSAADGTRPGQLSLGDRAALSAAISNGWATCATDTGYGSPQTSGARPCSVENRPRGRLRTH